MTLLSIVIILFFITGCNRPDSTSADSTPDSLAAGSQRIQTDVDPTTFLTYDQRRGKRLYKNYCVVCHGLGGLGDGFNAFNLNPRPKNLADSTFLRSISDQSLMQIITFGGVGVNRSVLMPAYRNTLSEAQIEYIVRYIRSFGNNE